MNYKRKIDRAWDELERIAGSGGVVQHLSTPAKIVYSPVSKTFAIRKLEQNINLTEKEMRSLYKYIKRVIIDE